MAYLYIEHKITALYKVTDMDGKETGHFLQKNGYGWKWIWPNGVERCESQILSREGLYFRVRRHQVWSLDLASLILCAAFSKLR